MLKMEKHSFRNNGRPFYENCLYNSFPLCIDTSAGKTAEDDCGKTLVRRVYERAILAMLPDVVIVATDHKDIEKKSGLLVEM